MHYNGFVYIWHDRKHKRYYIGSHQGDENDGYICSSNWMRNAYNRRPEDFKRRIITKITTTRKDLLTEENRWLSMIKKDELKIRYYNAIKHIIYNSKDVYWESWSKGKTKSLDQRNKISISVKALGKRADVSKKLKELWQDPEYRAKMTASHVGKKQTQEQILKRVATTKERGRNIGSHGHVPWNKGQAPSEELRKIYQDGWIKRKERYGLSGKAL